MVSKKAKTHYCLCISLIFILQTAFGSSEENTKKLIGIQIAKEQSVILLNYGKNTPEQKNFSEIENYLNNLAADWDTTLHLPYSEVPTKAQWWHKMFRFYFLDEMIEASNYAEIIDSPRELSLNSKNLPIPDKLKSFKRDFEYPDLLKQSIELRLQRMEAFSKCVEDILRKDTTGSITNLYFGNSMIDLTLNEFSQKLSQSDLNRISNSFANILSQLNRINNDSRLKSEFNEVGLKSFQSLSGLQNTIFPSLYKNNPKAFTEVADKILLILIAQLRVGEKFISGLPNGESKNEITAQFLIFLSKASVLVNSDLAVEPNKSQPSPSNESCENLFYFTDQLVFNSIGSDLQNNLLIDAMRDCDSNQYEKKAHWFQIQNKILEALPLVLRASSIDKTKSFLSEIQEIKSTIVLPLTSE